MCSETSMTTDYLTRLLTFREDTLPDLDEVVMGGLAYLGGLSLPQIDVTKHARPLVVGSGNALHTGKILFRKNDATCIEEGSFGEVLARGSHDAVYIVSASGSKHAGSLAAEAVSKNIPVYLITTTADSPAEKLVGSEQTFVYPRIREPYTYNTSTYLGMLFGNESVRPERVQNYIETVVEPLIGDLSAYRAFLMVVPASYALVCPMYEIKFDELFGPYVLGRGTTTEGVKHAKTVITAPHQCIISFGETCQYGNPGNRLTIPLMEDCTYPELIAIGYYVIGKIQKQHPPYFKDRIGAYTKETSEMFGQTIPVIVE
jgi:hypothetical protein